jgi:hypothetical protein
MDQECRAEILRKQEERAFVMRERERIVEQTCELIKKEIDPSKFLLFGLARHESITLLRIVEKIILNSDRGSATRHQYADGHGSLAGVDMSLEDIDAALAVVRKIRGIA